MDKLSLYRQLIKASLKQRADWLFAQLTYGSIQILLWDKGIF